MAESPGYAAARVIREFVACEINETQAQDTLEALGLDRKFIRRVLRDIQSHAQSQSEVLKTLGY